MVMMMMMIIIMIMMATTVAHSLIRSPHLVSFPGCDPAALRAEFLQLNRDQQAAVEKVLTTRDYAILLGMPGTGKTSTIAFVVRALVR
jgi:Cdc6-like AAA superfamily ATPase